METSTYGLDDFKLYQAAREFRKKIYSLIKKLPTEEKFALNPQMRRAAISVSNNVAEGHGRWHYKESMRFYRISRGSAEEIIDDLNICIDEHYFPEKELSSIKEDGYCLIKDINGYIAYLKKQQKTVPDLK